MDSVLLAGTSGVGHTSPFPRRGDPWRCVGTGPPGLRSWARWLGLGGGRGFSFRVRPGPGALSFPSLSHKKGRRGGAGGRRPKEGTPRPRARTEDRGLSTAPALDLGVRGVSHPRGEPPAPAPRSTACLPEAPNSICAPRCVYKQV